MASDDERKKTERIFQYWLTELRQREASNVSVVAITSSASLVMLALFGQVTHEGMTILGWLVAIVGIVFNGLGIAYRELSKTIMHEHQITELAMLMSKEDIEKKDAMRRYAAGRANWRREVIWKIIVLIPSVAWVIAVVTVSYEETYLSILAAIIMGFIAFATIHCLQRNDSKRQKQEEERFKKWLEEQNKKNKEC